MRISDELVSILEKIKQQYEGEFNSHCSDILSTKILAKRINNVGLKEKVL